MKNEKHLKNFVRKIFGAIKAADLYENKKYITLNWNDITLHYNKMEQICEECFVDYVAEPTNVDHMRNTFLEYGKKCSEERNNNNKMITCP